MHEYRRLYLIKCKSSKNKTLNQEINIHRLVVIDTTNHIVIINKKRISEPNVNTKNNNAK